MAKLPSKKVEPKQSQQPGLFDLQKSPSTSDKTISAMNRISRYGFDLVGVMVLSFGLILLLGVIGFSKGTLLSRLVLTLKSWFGLGRFLLVLAILWLGWIIVRWRKYPPSKIEIGKIITLEIAAFILLGLLSSLFDKNLDLIKEGKSLGGLIGWGIADIFSFLGNIGKPIVLIILLFLLLGAGLNFFGKLERVFNRDRIEESSTSITSEDKLTIEQQTPIRREPISSQTVREAKPHTTISLPPEYRKSFKVPENEESKAVENLKRDPNLPPLDLLEKEKSFSPDQATINMTAGLIEKTLADFGIPAKVVGYRVGPTVTQYAVEPGYLERNGTDDRHKIRISQISALSKDLTLALRAERLRIEAPVPGKSYVGIEVPNNKNVVVRLRPILESETFFRVNSPLAIPLGRDVSGKAVVSDLATMPHLLIAGTTNSGKSVCIASIITCLAMNNTPDGLKMVLIDPKMVELTRFNGLPHILGQVETNVDRIMAVLRWATAEMDYRYQLLEKVRARNLDSYNAKAERAGQAKLPRVVVLIDELADLMMSAPEQTEHALVRLAQKSRAVGIHLVVATQRPSTDVVTGVIKANFPTRIAFTVASSVDSRVILDTSGAETLLGKGDMLFLHPEAGLPVRTQGAMVTDRELENLVRWWKTSLQGEEEAVVSEEVPWEEDITNNGAENGDEDLINQAVDLLRKDGRASASFFQRQLRIGYPRAARLIEQLEAMNIIGPAQGGGKEREILIDLDKD